MKNNASPLYSNIFISFSILLLIGCTACSPDIYSIVVTNPGTQHETNPLNDLAEPYHKKLTIIPTTVQLKGDAFAKLLEDSLQQLVVHKVDTTLKLSVGSVEIVASACGMNGVALVIIDRAQLKNHGKKVDVKLRYVCCDDEFNAAWGVTDFYKIDASDMCMDGFHTLEFELFAPSVLKNERSPNLRSVLAVCADL